MQEQWHGVRRAASQKALAEQTHEEIFVVLTAGIEAANKALPIVCEGV